jgi:hypothetical protein
MGMFDYVDFKLPCPGCGTEVNGFQSKDGECYLNAVKPTDVNHFYDSCDKCGGWIEFRRKPAKDILADFDMTFVPRPTPQRSEDGATEGKEN